VVNIFEDNLGIPEIKSVRDKIFKTETGRRILNTVYLDV
jgi:hypothetical protein